jgi:hypothetical protein
VVRHDVRKANSPVPQLIRIHPRSCIDPILPSQNGASADPGAVHFAVSVILCVR